MPFVPRDPALGGIVVEEKGSLSTAKEIQPATVSVLVEERIDFLIRPEPTHSFLPEPKTGRRALHGVYPTELFMPGRRVAEFG